MSQDKMIEILSGIDRKLSAIVAMYAYRLLLEDEDLGRAKARSIDRLLADAGLKQGEVADLLGKSPQAVSQMLKKG
jgi:hypothetical protein